MVGQAGLWGICRSELGRPEKGPDSPLPLLSKWAVALLRLSLRAMVGKGYVGLYSTVLITLLASDSSKCHLQIFVGLAGYTAHASSRRTPSSSASWGKSGIQEDLTLACLMI